MPTGMALVASNASTSQDKTRQQDKETRLIARLLAAGIRALACQRTLSNRALDELVGQRGPCRVEHRWNVADHFLARDGWIRTLDPGFQP